jgi:hypothetical protein
MAVIGVEEGTVPGGDVALTTEAFITEIPKQEKAPAAPPMPEYGGVLQSSELESSDRRRAHRSDGRGIPSDF